MKSNDSEQVKGAKTHTSGNETSKIVKKGWKVRTFDNQHQLQFNPVFRVNTAKDAPNELVLATDKDIECRFIDMVVDKKEYRLNFLDIFMFIYTCANEELRQQLNLRYERNYTKIPYNVTFNLTPEEKTTGKATRLIELELDEVAMAMARAEARKYAGKDPGDYNTWFLKKKGVDTNKLKLS